MYLSVKALILIFCLVLCNCGIDIPIKSSQQETEEILFNPAERKNKTIRTLREARNKRLKRR